MGRGEMMKNSGKTKLWIALFLVPTIIIFAAFYFIPLTTVFVTSFSKWDGDYHHAPVFNGIANYVKLITYDDKFANSIRNLFLWSLFGATAHVAFGTLVAFVFYEKPFGFRVVRAVFMLPNVISAAALAMIYKFIFNDQVGLLNNMVRAIGFKSFHIDWFYESPFAFFAVMFTWLFYAVYVTLIVYGDLMAIPKEIHESALIEGASKWQVRRYINLPLVKNAIATGILLAVTSRISGFEEVALTTRGGPGHDTYNLALMLYNGLSNSQYGYANATATMMIILGMGLLVLLNKLFKMNEKIY